MKLITVIHIINKNIEFIVKQCKKAFDGGTFGIFLIPYSSEINPEDVNEIYYQVRNKYKNNFIGLNYLADIDEYINIIPPCVSAIWTDEGIGNENNYYLIEKINSIKKELGFLYFGGFYHKGNNYNFKISDVYNNKNSALKLIDILTTTGLGTGIEIEEKIYKIITNNIPTKKLAIASGLDASNIHKYRNKIGYAIVGSSLEETNDVGSIKRGYICKNKIKDFIKASYKLI